MRPPLSPETVVKVLDRDNYGYVIEDFGDEVEVEFRPEGGPVYAKRFPRGLIEQATRTSATKTVPVRKPISDYDAWRFKNAIEDHRLGDDLPGISERFRPVLNELWSMKKESRRRLLEVILSMTSDRDAILAAVDAANADGPPPDPEENRPANLADLRAVMADSSWLWEGYLPSARIVGIGAFEGIGKTRFAMDLARRLWFELLWPDGQPQSFPARTPTLWICADGQQDELAETALSFGMPNESIYFNTPHIDPYGGTEIDNPDDRARLEEYILKIKPGLVFVDTLTNATDHDLCHAAEVKSLMTPLRDIAQRTETTIVIQSHLSKEGQALGRRIKGIVRTLLKLERSEDDESGRLRLSVEKSFAKKPSALGVTMTDAGNEYDNSPPNVAKASKGGRPSVSRDKARAFIVKSLTAQNDRKATELCSEWQAAGNAKDAFWRARDFMVEQGELTSEGKPLILHLLQRSEPDPTSPGS